MEILMPFCVAVVYRVMSVGVLTAIFGGNVAKLLKWDEICASLFNMVHRNKSATTNRGGKEPVL
jgi:hypothetical protein